MDSASDANPAPSEMRQTRLAFWLSRAVERGDLRQAQRFLAMGADPFLAPDRGGSPLLLAARAPKAAFLRAMLAGRPAPLDALSDALAELLGCSGSLLFGETARASRAQALLLAAGEQKTAVAAHALERLLRQGFDVDPRPLIPLVDFSTPAPSGESWLSFLVRPDFSDSRAEALAAKAFATAWDAREKTKLPLDDLGFSPVHRASSRKTSRFVKIVAGEADFGAAAAHGQVPLEMAAIARAQECFDFLLDRSPKRPDAFGRDPFLRALIGLGQSLPGSGSMADLDKSSQELARRADPWTVDVLGRRFADWALLLGFEAAGEISRQRQALAEPPVDALEFPDAIADQALLLEITRLGFRALFSMNSNSKLEADALALGRKLSCPSATCSLLHRSALEVAVGYGFFDLAFHLIEAGASLAPSSAAQPCALASALGCRADRWNDPRQRDLIQRLARPESARHVDRHGQDALGMAIQHKAPAWVVELLAPMSDLPARGSVYLERAARQDSPEAFDALWLVAEQDGSLAAWAIPGADPSWPEACASSRHAQRLLARQRAIPEGVSGRRAEGKSLLIWAAQGGSSAVAQATAPLAELASLCDPNAVDDLGRDALMTALESGFGAGAIFLANHCDLSRRDGLGMSTLDYARMTSHGEAGELVSQRVEALRQAQELRQASRLESIAPKPKRI